MEVLSQLKIVYDLGYINEIKYTELRNLIDIISISLCKLRNYQQHQFKLLNLCLHPSSKLLSKPYFKIS